ncbi:FecCD family ABC transporter permease [Streptomonospora litoralis]|uniref:Putative siderophore transport system permease protein YfhA n=1 Tax=Streptomonospora litoralis TaxID=2498135 RepID=A0A4P6QA31_9ACTN|nr:iron chelate uptake ABC transporter family permease subunit [Streptomonospora litoralis]QBI56224.1 putative siderophore transport system permease protein YfhA [Streptomonospora litoralis]
MIAGDRGAFLLRSPRAAVVFRFVRRSTALTLLAWLLAGGVALLSLTLGQFDIGVSGVLRVLGGGGTLIEYDVVVRNRLPRALTGLGVGAAFALSGAILQRIAANPLVSPDVIGVNSGAAFGALTVITVFGGTGLHTVAGALVGAAVTAAAIFLLSARRGLSGYRLVLVGIGVAAMLTSAVSFLLTRADYHRVMAAAAWLTGSLANRSSLHVAIIATTLAVAVPVLVVLARQVRLLELGDDLAKVLSGHASSTRIALVAAAVVLAAMATAAAGPIGFIALVAPQIVRRMLPGRGALLAPAAGLGALLVVAADLAARLLFTPAELPVGVMTGVLGAPVLLYLLARANRIGHTG